MSTLEQNPLREQVRSLIHRFRASGLYARYLRELLAIVILLRWADYQEAEEEAMAEFEDRPWHPVLPSELRWRAWYHLPWTELSRVLFHDLPDYLRYVRSKSEGALAAKLSAIQKPLQDLELGHAEFAAEVVHWFGELPFETSNDRRLLLESFDEIIAGTLERDERQYVSTSAIAKLAVAIADPRPGDRVYDPCFGYAGFLTAAWEHTEKSTRASSGRRVGVPISVFGVEIRSSAYLIGLARLILSGVVDPHVECGNSLEREPHSGQNGQGFDVALANPPIGSRFSGDTGAYQHFPVRSRDSTGLFIQHVLLQLGKKGRALMAIPEGFLFRGGGDRELRKYLIERGHIEAVIALPEGVFAPYTMVRGSLLVLRKEGGADQVRMIDARPFFRKATSGRAPALPAEQLQDFLIFFKQTWAVSDTQPSQLKAAVDVRSLESRGKQASDIREEKEPTLWAFSTKELSAADWDLTPRRREKGRLDEVLSDVAKALGGAGTIAHLGQCAELFAGRSIISKDLAVEAEGESPICYVRIKDIRRGTASEGSSWIRAEALSKVVPKWRLQPGDVLLSKSGTIGKAGIVRNGAIGGVAANGLYVIRVDKDRLDPHFLLAYLASPVCQNWLASQSRGAVIQHLTFRVLEQLPVPLPPLSLQQRAVTQSREGGMDVIEFLIQASDTRQRDLIAPWIEGSLTLLRSNVESVSDPFALSFLDTLADSVRPIRNRAAHGEFKGPLTAWLIAVAEALSRLRDVTHVPKSPALLSLLKDTSRELRRTRELVRGSSPVESQGRALNELVADWLERATSALLADVNLVFTPTVSTIPLGEAVELLVSIENRGVLPLRHLHVLTSPDWGHADFGFVPERDGVKIGLRGEAPKVAGVFSITVSWAAQNLDGQPLSGDRQLSFSVVSAKAPSIEVEELGGSPYVTGTPVFPNRNDVFFGRAALLEQISRQIAASGNVVLLEGNRRAGKTSVLRHLEGPSAIPGWLGVYCSLQGSEGADGAVGVPTAEIFRSMANSIADALVKLNIDVPLPNGSVLAAGKPSLGVGRACREGISEASSFTDFRDYLGLVLEKLRPRGLGIVLMLDEFDKLQEGIDHGVTSPQVPENIRFLVQSYPGFSAILTGSRRLKRLREEYWSALFGLGTRFGVSALDRDEARRLVVEPVKGKLTFSPESVERAISVTACQPFLMQCLCNRIFDFAAQTKTRSITLDVVDEAGSVLVKDNEHFASLWGYAGSYRRRLILMLCAQRSGATEQVTFGELQELLTQRGIEITDDRLDADLSYLRELELIDLVGTSGNIRYQLSIPLMAAWMETHQDFDAILRQAQAEVEEENA